MSPEAALAVAYSEMCLVPPETGEAWDYLHGVGLGRRLREGGYLLFTHDGLNSDPSTHMHTCNPSTGLGAGTGGVLQSSG